MLLRQVVSHKHNSRRRARTQATMVTHADEHTCGAMYGIQTSMRETVGCQPACHLLADA